jgi:large subunit ribosomal protein L9
MKRSRDVRDGRDREGAEEVARRLVSAVIKIEARVGSGEQLYGSVTTMEIAEAVKTQTGVELDRRRMNLASAIKTTGSHSVEVRLHREVQFSLLVEVAAQN